MDSKCEFGGTSQRIQFTNTMRYLAALLTGLLGLLCLTLSAQTDCEGADHTILAGNFYYNPASLAIAEGETVAWVNEGGTHDVNGEVSVISGETFNNPEAFSLPVISGNMSGVCMGVHTFTIAGEYNYDCSIGQHAANGMVGTILVEAASVECNDDLACNYDPASTSDTDCEYYDGNFNLSDGLWIVAGASLNPDYGCDIQPAEGILVQLDITEGQPVSIAVDEALENWVNGLVDEGLLTALNGTLALSAFNNALFSFCGETVTGDAGLLTITSDWNGQAWSIQEFGFNLAPAGEMPSGCPDPAANNFDPCANPDTTLCEYDGELDCNDPLACNYDTAATGVDGCVFFDTNLFTLEEDMFIGLTDFEDCPTGYPGAYTIPADLTQEDTGLPLFFTITPEVESFLIEQGYEIAAQDIITVAVSVCDTVMNYNSLVLGDEDLTWDGIGFTIDFYGSFIAPESSFEVGCPDPEACNFDACAHPEFADGCTYLDFSAIETASGDTGMVTMTELDSLTFTVTAEEDVTLEWSTDCGDLIVDGNTATLTATGTGDCEVCVEVEGPGECEGESCIVVSVLGGLNEPSNTTWELMPNPAATDLRVVWKGPTSIFEVFDLNGRIIHTTALQTGTQTIDVSELHPGLYLAGPQGTAPKRLAIQR